MQCAPPAKSILFACHTEPSISVRSSSAPDFETSTCPKPPSQSRSLAPDEEAKAMRVQDRLAAMLTAKGASARTG